MHFRRACAVGYSYHDGEWLTPAPVAGAPLPFRADADVMHGMLMLRADALSGCTESSEEETEFQAIVDLPEACEVKRWPLGKDPNVPGGKGEAADRRRWPETR